MAAAMRRRAVPNAPAAAQADPPPGVGDADANASRTSLSGLSANEATGRVGGLVARAPRLGRLGVAAFQLHAVDFATDVFEPRLRFVENQLRAAFGLAHDPFGFFFRRAF